MKRFLPAMVAVAVLTACASSTPLSRYHSLLPLPDDGQVGALASVPWQMLPVTVPAQVDRPQWVVRTADASLAMLEGERWIAPLADEVGAALSEVLTRRLGPPAPATGWRVRVDVQRLESWPGKFARFDAVWALQGAQGAWTTACTERLQVPAPGGYVALAQAHRRAVKHLGTRIAESLQAAHAGRPVDCPQPGQSPATLG